MKRGIVVGVAGVAIAVAACAGCSSNKTSTGASSSAASSAAGPQVIVDGQKQNISGAITCTPAGDNINIGIGDATNGVGAVISNGNPPIVHSVGLGSVNGVTLGFSDAAPNQAAKRRSRRRRQVLCDQGHRDRLRREQSAATAAGDQVIRDGRDLPLVQAIETQEGT